MSSVGILSCRSTDVPDNVRLRQLKDKFQHQMQKYNFEQGINTLTAMLSLPNMQSQSEKDCTCLRWEVLKELNECYHSSVEKAKNSREITLKNFYSLAIKKMYPHAIVFYPRRLPSGHSLFKFYLKTFTENRHDIFDKIAETTPEDFDSLRHLTRTDLRFDCGYPNAYKRIEMAMTAHALRKMGKNRECLAVLKELTNECGDNVIPEIYSESAYAKLTEGNNLQAREMFGECLERLGLSPEVNKIWQNTFDNIARFFSHKLPERLDPQHLSDQKEQPDSVKKIILSGFGRSGSNALFDYLKEFSHLCTIEHEFQFVNLVGNFYQKAAGKSGIKPSELLTSFSTVFFGISFFMSYVDYKPIRYAKCFTMGWSDVEKYAVAINKFFYRLITELISKSINPKVFRPLASTLTNDILGPCMKEKQEKVVMNNFVNAFNIPATSLPDDFVLFAVRRDPRSQYVALKWEDEKKLFHRVSSDVNRFIDWYRETQMKAKKDINKLVNDGNAGEMVQFEKLVLSEEYRRSVAEKAGLDFATQNEYAYLKPWESEKNVFLHEQYENQDEIKAIENALPEYCVDLERLRSKDRSDRYSN